MVSARSAGFTLIEILVTLTLTTLLLLMAAPLTRAWIANAHIAKAESQLRQAYAKARVLALRNPAGVISTASAATLTASASSLTVQQGNNGTTTWSDTLDGDTSVALANGCANRLALDNNGLALNSTCLSYTISALGGSSATGKLY